MPPLLLLWAGTGDGLSRISESTTVKSVLISLLEALLLKLSAAQSSLMLKLLTHPLELRLPLLLHLNLTLVDPSSSITFISRMYPLLSKEAQETLYSLDQVLNKTKLSNHGDKDNSTTTRVEEAASHKAPLTSHQSQQISLNQDPALSSVDQDLNTKVAVLVTSSLSSHKEQEVTERPTIPLPSKTLLTKLLAQRLFTSQLVSILLPTPSSYLPVLALSEKPGQSLLLLDLNSSLRTHLKLPSRLETQVMPELLKSQISYSPPKVKFQELSWLNGTSVTQKVNKV